MRIQLNSKDQELTSDDPTIRNVLADQGVDLTGMVAVRLNGRILKRKEWDHIRIEDEDKIEVLHFYGGG